MSARYILNKGFVVYSYLKLFEIRKGSENDMRRVDSHEFFFATFGTLYPEYLLKISINGVYMHFRK